MSEETKTEHIWCYDTKSSWTLREYTALETDTDKKSGKDMCVLTLTDEPTTQLKVLAENTATYNASHKTDFKDVTRMDDLHEAPMMHLLRRRYEQNMIYTEAGDVLISVNPYEDIEGLYDMPLSDSFAKQPHVFNVSQRAFLQLNETHGNQVILVNGESGAGKTEATKKMLSYLVFLNSRSKQEQGTTLQEAQAATDSVEDLVMASNEIFEAFGNAATVNNVNSSRFGKFLQLRMKHNVDRQDETDRTSYFVCGVQATQFLLETSRLSLQAPGESNFHILYQMIAGATDEQRTALQLAAHANDYAYLQTRGLDDPDLDPDLDPEDNLDSLSSQFLQSVECLKKIGFSAENIQNCLRVLAGILALGNVVFTPISEDQEGAKVDDITWLKRAGELLGLGGAAGLSHVFTHRSTAAGGGVGRGRRSSGYSIPLTPQQSASARDGLCKILYSSIFDLIFDTFNKTGAVVGGLQGGEGHDDVASNNSNDDDKLPFIGILDIFGFEILESNNFEQLCINFANESLQSLFNDHMFVFEMDIYNEEEINCEKIEYTDNYLLLQLFTDKKSGIFTLIDEQGLLGARGSDAAVLAGLTKIHGRAGKEKPGHPNYTLPKMGNESFVVKHYAGDVEYQVSELLAKNSDSVHHDLMALGSDSEDPFVTVLMETYNQRRQGGSKGGGSGEQKEAALKRTESTQLLGSTTISQRVKLQMDTLSNIIRACTPHFVRCIKPNHIAKPAPNMDLSLVVKQLRFLGLMETCRIRRQGYPIRSTFSSLVLRFGPLVPEVEGVRHTWTQYTRDEDGAQYYYNSETQETSWNKPEGVDISMEDTQRDMCERLLTKYVAEPETLDWQLGLTKYFLKDRKIELLDAALTAYYQDEENARKEIAAHAIQQAIRARLARNEMANRKLEKLKEEERLRRLAAEAEEKRLADLRAAADEDERRRLEATIKVQAIARGRIAKKEGFLKRQLAMRKSASTKLQALHRMRSQQKMFQEQKDVITKIQALKRMKSRRASMAVKKKALVKIQSTVRMRKERMDHSIMLTSIKLVQRNYRGFRVRAKVQIVKDAREDWKQFLSPNEAVLFASLVRKEAGGGVAKLLGFKKRRQLLMTSRPRFLYVDPNDMSEVKGDIDIVSEEVQVDLAVDLEKEEQKTDPDYKASKNDISQDFRVHTPKRVYLFTDLLGFATQWKKSALDYEKHRAAANVKGTHARVSSSNFEAARPQGETKEGGERKVMPMFIGVGDMVKRGFDIQHSRLIQGYLTKQSIKGRFGKKWTKRWFVLHGHTLYYFKSEYVIFAFVFFFLFFF